MPLSNANLIKNYIATSTGGYNLLDSEINELDRYTTILTNQVKILPYIWYNAKYSNRSVSGTPANATTTTIFNLGNKARENIWEFEKIQKDGSINSLYDGLNEINGTASTATGLLDVVTIGATRPIYNLTGSKIINTNQTQATGHFTFAVSLNLATTTNQTLLDSSNTGGLSITTNASSQVVFGRKGGANVVFNTAITTGARSIIISYDSFSRECLLYLDGRLTATTDDVSFFSNIEKQNLIIGAINGTAQNIMIFNDFLGWERARDLHYLISYQHNITQMPIIVLKPTQKAPFTSQVRENIRNTEGFGYDLTNEQYIDYNSKIELFNLNGGLPSVWHRADLSVNRNLFNNTNLFSGQTITLPLGFFEFWFESGNGSITSSNGTGIATNHGVVTSGQNNSRVIEVTTAGTFTFTNNGIVNNASLQHSLSGGLDKKELIYQKIDNPPVSVNFDSAGWTLLFGTIKVNSTRLRSRTSNNPDARFALDNFFISSTIAVKFTASLPAGGSANLTIDYGDGTPQIIPITGTPTSFEIELSKGAQNWVDFSLSSLGVDYVVGNLQFIKTEVKSLGVGTSFSVGDFTGTNRPFKSNIIRQSNRLVYNFTSSNATRLETSYSESTPVNFSAIFKGIVNLSADRVLWNKGTTSDRVIITSAGAVQFSSNTGTVTTANGIVNNNTLTTIHITGAGNNISIYVNGLNIATTGTVTRTSNTSKLEISRATTPLEGIVSDFVYFANLTHTNNQVLSIYNNIFI